LDYSDGKTASLPVWNRSSGKLLQEFMDDHPSTYESWPRCSLTQWLESEPLYDWLVAAYQNTQRSARQIDPFIKKHNIDMSEFKPVIYQSFAEFFDREFRPGVRPFVTEPHEIAAFAKARYFGWNKIDVQQQFLIKGRSLNAEQVLGSKKRAALFTGGPVLLGRLSPMDYHHVHYPDDGTTLEKAKLGRSLWMCLSKI
jgi:phosphatidylserine decarboxylase